MKRVLVIYYTQTGQLRRILDSLLSSFEADTTFSLDYLEIQPPTPYPFPWSRNAFLGVFPESVLETRIALKPLNMTLPGAYDLIFLAFQPWYLSPSLPISSFLQTKEAAELIRGTDVVTVVGARNMWIKSFERVKERVENLGGRLKGNIVLVDHAPNLVSVVTICYWMFTGKKDRYLKMFPRPGVSDNDIAAASQFGAVCRKIFLENRMDDLEETLAECGAADRNDSLARLENRAKRIFRLWAKVIAKCPNIRRLLLNLFFVELILGLFILSPLYSLIGSVQSLFRKRIKQR